MSLKDKFNGSGSRIWITISVGIITFTSGYAIGAYRALGELKPLIVETSTEVRNLKERVNELKTTMDRHIEVKNDTRK